MDPFKSRTQGVPILLVALLVCQAFMVPSLARTQVVIGEKKLAEPKPPDVVTPQGHGGHEPHAVKEVSCCPTSGGAEYVGHGYPRHGHKNGGHDEARHKGGHA